MAQEKQNIEWKETWRDEYIKWISGFANANGGKLYIGINDKGIVSGITDAKKLLEELPNKIKDLLGILVDVNLRVKTKLQYIEIKVDAYPFPISYKGQYHYRSGSTKQELKGAALDKFILGKQGKKWDSVPVPKLLLRNLSTEQINILKTKALSTGRLAGNLLQQPNNLILQNLGLYDGKYYNRATVLLLYPQPDVLITGAFIKIGFFDETYNLLYQDLVYGTLYEQVNKTMNLLLTKYLKAYITYKGIARVEKYLFPEMAIRETLLNAVSHKDYSTGIPIQIKVFANKISIFNTGQLPENWTIDNLLKSHPSLPYNPLLSNAFFIYGFIEAWGQGIHKIIAECKKYEINKPQFSTTSIGMEVAFECENNIAIDTNNDTNDDTNNDTNDDTNGDTNGDTNDDTKGDTNDDTNGDTNGDTNDDTDGDTDTIKNLIIEILKAKPTATVIEMAEALKKSRITILRYLEKLKDEKKIQRSGNNKTGYWKIKTPKINEPNT